MKEQTHVIEGEFLAHRPSAWITETIRQEIARWRRKAVNLMKTCWQDLAATAIITVLLLIIIYCFLNQLALSGW